MKGYYDIVRGSRWRQLVYSSIDPIIFSLRMDEIGGDYYILFDPV
jgi:hypothetical protein